MKPYYSDETVKLWHGDCLDVLRGLPDASVDAVVTDPPYGLANTDPAHVAETITRWVNGERDYLPGGAGFMGKAWDAFVPPVAVWDDCLRVLKPGGHVLCFAGSRTMDLMTLGLRLAGFEIRDSIAWLYGSGFPKSLDVSKAIDKARDDRDDVLRVTSTLAELASAAGITRADIDAHMGTSDMGGWWLSKLRHRCACPSVENWTRLRDFVPGAHVLDDLVWRLNGRKGSPGEAWGQREVVGSASVPIGHAFAGSTYGGDSSGRIVDITAPATPDAERWQGWGTALKPSHEPVVVARKPAGPTAILDTIGSQLGALEEACRRRVSGAARSSAPTPADSSAARTATAPESAATQHEAGQESTTATGAAGGSSAATATSASVWTAETFSSTVTSWRKCWAEIYEATSMSTTSTGTGRTTDLQTLSSCLSSIMQSVTAQSTLDPRSWSSLATAADNLFAAGVLSSRSTLALSAIESATSATQQDSPHAVGSGAAFEPVVVARKPLSGTVAANVLQHGTGALNIDATRVEHASEADRAESMGKNRHAQFGTAPGGNNVYGDYSTTPAKDYDGSKGRWPTNVVLDDSQAAELDRQSGVSKDGTAVNRNADGGRKRAEIYGDYANPARPDVTYGGEGGASRFFPTFRYEAKAPTSERPRYTRPMLRLRGDLTPAQVDHVRARLAEAGVQVD